MEAMMNDEWRASVIGTALDEFKKMKAHADRALVQVGDAAFFDHLDEESNSIAIILKHLGGNLTSRWTDFLTTDGEKPTRNRDGEFEDAATSRAAIVEGWERGYRRLVTTLESLAPGDLMRIVTIRGESLTVLQALVRALAHTSAHVGQVVLLAKHYAGPRWQTLSMPRVRQTTGLRST